MRRAAKKDGNHNTIADYLRGLGWSVLDLSRVGDGCPDMAVGRPGFAALVECKLEGEELNEKQVKVRDGWEGPYIIAYSPEDAAGKLLAAWRGWI